MRFYNSCFKNSNKCLCFSVCLSLNSLTNFFCYILFDHYYIYIHSASENEKEVVKSSCLNFPLSPANVIHTCVAFPELSTK